MQTRSMDQSDEALMQAYQHGDKKAFDILYQRYSGKVYGYLKTAVRDAALAEDIFQATFLKLHRTRAKYDPACAFAPWVFTICRSVMIDALRKKKRTLEDSNDLAVEQAEAPALAAAGAEPVAVVELAVDGAGRAIAAMPEPQRQALTLRYSGEMSFEEIASRLQTSPANARQLVSRAVRRLRGLAGKGGLES